MIKKEKPCRIIKGHLIHTKTPLAFECLAAHYLVIKNDCVFGVFRSLDSCQIAGIDTSQIVVEDYGDCLIVPGFVDLHCHAPQYRNRGLGLDQPLLGWLESYTFPEESKFESESYAKSVYEAFVKELYKNGTLHSVLFGTIHLEATILLMNELEKAGLLAYVGLVNMDRNAPDSLCVETQESLINTKKWYEQTKNAYENVKPILTPRFIPSCTDTLMRGLTAFGNEVGAPLQSHLAENQDEIEWVKTLCPESQSYTEAYENRGALSHQTIMAHCVHNTQEEMDILKSKDVMVAHCPNANINLSSGLMPIRKFLDTGVRVGLGSDVGAGHQLFVPQLMVQAIQMSKMVTSLVDRDLRPLNPSEAFYLGTKGGGAFFGNVGSFEFGYKADFLIINDSLIGATKDLSLEERIQRFMYCGDDRTIQSRYVNGNRIDKSLE